MEQVKENLSLHIGISADSKGFVYVADTGNNRIQKFDSQGKFVSRIGALGDDPGEFKSPSSIAVDSKDFVYVADTDNNRIQKFDSNERYVSSWSSTGGHLSQSNLPKGIARGFSRLCVRSRHR